MEALSKNELNVPYLSQIIDVIVSFCSPDMIILFRSYARGDATEKSDIDLLILKKDLEKEKERTISQNLEMELFRHNIAVATDLIAMNYERYFKLTDVIGYIYKSINRERVVVYETVHRMA